MGQAMKNDKSDHLTSRRNALKSSAAILGGGLVMSDYAGAEIKNVNRRDTKSGDQSIAKHISFVSKTT